MGGCSLGCQLLGLSLVTPCQEPPECQGSCPSAHSPAALSRIQTASPARPGPRTPQPALGASPPSQDQPCLGLGSPHGVLGSSQKRLGFALWSQNASNFKRYWAWAEAPDAWPALSMRHRPTVGSLVLVGLQAPPRSPHSAQRSYSTSALSGGVPTRSGTGL